MKKITIALLSLILVIPLFSQTEKADAVYKKLIREYTLYPDGSYDFKLEKELELLTHFSFHRLYGETFVVYNPDFESLKIDYAYTIMQDGKKIETPDNAFNEVLPRYAAHAPAYNQLRKMVITHTGLEVGAVIHLGYTIHNTSDFYDAFMGEVYIDEYSPIEKEIVRVKIPINMELNYQTYNIRTAPVITTEKGFNIYTWTFRNLGMRSHDNYQPEDSRPVIVFSTAKKLQIVVDRFCSQDAFRMETTREMNIKVNEIVEESKDQIEIMIKLQKLVVNEISTYNIPLSETGFKIRTPAEVWISNGGTPVEKTLLLAALLREANINAIPVAATSDKFFDRKLGNLYVFDEFFLQVNPRETKQYYISATNWQGHNLLYDLHGKTMIQLDHAIESLRSFEAKSELFETDFGCGFAIENTERMSGNITLELFKTANPYLNMITNTDYAKQLIKNTIGISDINSFDLEKTSEVKSLIRYEIVKENPFTEKSGYYFMTLPETESGLQDMYLSHLPEERSTPLELENPVNLKYFYTFSKPENLEFVNPAKKIIIDNEAGKIHIEIRKSGDEILITRNLEIRKKIIPLNKYKAFRELMVNWYDDKYRQLILR